MKLDTINKGVDNFSSEPKKLKFWEKVDELFLVIKKRNKYLFIKNYKSEKKC